MEPARERRRFCHNGYFYKLRKNRNGNRHYTCSQYPRTGCPASGKVQGEGEFQDINPNHNHPRVEGAVAAELFRTQLRNACMVERGNLKNIYERIALNNVEGAESVTFNSIRRSMRRWRQTNTPHIPQTLPELSQILNTGSVNAGDTHAVIFGNSNFLDNFVDSQYTFVDGTFKAVPRRPTFSQILTIFGTCMDHAFPLVHVFMSHRTRQLYDAVFQYIYRTFPRCIRGTVITDYEAALYQSIKATFPDVQLQGCFFHYCQALMRKAKQLGVAQQIGQEQALRIYLRKHYALALLPGDRIVDAFNSLQDREREPIFGEFRDYIRRQWIERVTPLHFSVFGQRHRTNNVMEAYHRRLNSKLVRHPGVWDLIEILIDIQNIADLELRQLERHPQVFRVARRNILFDARIRQAWDKLADGRFTTGDFLRQAVHFVKGMEGQLQWNDEQHMEGRNDIEEAQQDQFDLINLNVPLPNPIPNEPPPLAPLQRPNRLIPENRHPILNQPPPLIFLQPRNPNYQYHHLNEPPPLAPLSNQPPPLILLPRNPNIQNHDLDEPLPLAFHLNEPLPLAPFQRPVVHPDPVIIPSPSPPREILNPDPDLNPDEPLRTPSPLDLPDWPPFPQHPPDFFINPPGPIPLMQNFNFPEIPAEIGRLFSTLGDDDDQPDLLPPAVDDPWVPALEATAYDDQSMTPELQCKVCLSNRIQYVLECGHALCSTCTAVLFNAQSPRCGLCRGELHRDRQPITLYL